MQREVVEINTGHLEDQAGVRGCPRVSYSDAGGLTRDEGSGPGRAVLVDQLEAAAAGHTS